MYRKKRSRTTEAESSSTPLSEPICLQGQLQFRKGGSGAIFRWKQRFVHLDFSGGGSVTVYRGSSPPPDEIQRPQLHRHLSVRNPEMMDKESSVVLHVPSDWPWEAKDVENDAACFVIEIATSIQQKEEPSAGEVSPSLSMVDSSRDEEDTDETDNLSLQTPLSPISEESLKDDMAYAKSLGKSLRLYFRCKSSSSSNEKGLWLRAFERLGRLSQETRRKKYTWMPILPRNRVRIRTFRDAIVARDARRLDLDAENRSSDEEKSVHIANDVEYQVRGIISRSHTREYRVHPTYAYPHRWMTRQEMRDEMVLPSSQFHDLRVADSREKEIGSFKVEVLQCIGLPKLDRVNDTDAVCYLVCGSYAFTTDVIPNRVNPMWLRNTRRACIFPVFQGYARFYAGVFDNDPRRVKDDFAGRIAIDLARLRPGTSYDVTLPLRVSTHVYCRRRRGAIRLRFTLNWTPRDALLSYIPKTLKIPLPQHSKPNTGITVACADEKAFRNICITVHGAHLPGRFTFQQMRAAIREINFTRKYLLTSLRMEIRDTRTWKNPGVSAYVFLTWMHCVYRNAASLVPAYFVFYLLLQLIRTYVKYGIDSAAQRGFVPPSWEEMFSSLLNKDPNFRAIQPLELGLRPLSLRRRSSSQSRHSSREIDLFKHKVATHIPRGKWLFRALGFMPNTVSKTRPSTHDANHLEFPFADGRVYPKFTVKESLVERKGEDTVSSEMAPARTRSKSNGSYQVTATKSGEIRTIIPRFDMHLDELMRKNSSGFSDRDGELNYFAPRKAMYYSGKRAGQKAASTLTYAASEITEKTGLHTVVNPIKDGIGTGLNHVRDGVSSGVDMLSPSHWRAAHGEDRSTKGNSSRPRSRSHDFSCHDSVASTRASLRKRARSYDQSTDYESFFGRRSQNGSAHSDAGSMGTDSDEEYDDDNASAASFALDDVWAAAQEPVQDIDVEGQSSGKRPLADDLDEIKDKMHELTWHLFDDKAYILEGENKLYFGHAKRPEKRQKKDVGRRLDKLLSLGQYSHSNPFVARVGLYVEPIIGSVYSFLCLFRASFNVVTWRDPMLTFWLSVALVLAGLVLLIFPWRLFLFVVGIALVGPQNWAIRILRETGRLPPTMPFKLDTAHEEEGAVEISGQPIFSSTRPNRNGVLKPPSADPREVHRVVVPSNPLIYQRFFDWPPEPQYAQAKPEAEPKRNATEDPPSRPRRIRRGASAESAASSTSFANQEGKVPYRNRTLSYSFQQEN